MDGALEAPPGEQQVGATGGPQDLVERGPVEPVDGGCDDQLVAPDGQCRPGGAAVPPATGCTAAAGGTTPTTIPPTACTADASAASEVSTRTAAAPTGRQRSSRQATSASCSGRMSPW